MASFLFYKKSTMEFCKKVKRNLSGDAHLPEISKEFQKKMEEIVMNTGDTGLYSVGIFYDTGTCFLLWWNGAKEKCR